MKPSADDPSSMLLAKVKAPQPLSDVQVERIARQLRAAPRQGRSGRRLVWAGALAGLLALVGWRAGWHARRPTAAGPFGLQVPHGETLISRDSGRSMAIVGPTQLSYDERRAPRLAQGRLVVRAGPTGTRVHVPGGQVLVPAGGTVETSFFESHLKVAAYVGRARVEWWDSGQVIELESAHATACGPGPCSRPEPVAASEGATAAGLFAEPGPDPASEPASASPSVPPRSDEPKASTGVTHIVRRPPLAPRPLPPSQPNGWGLASPATEVELPPAPQPAGPPSPTLADESAALEETLHGLRQRKDPASALTDLRRYRERFPAGVLAAAADRIEVEARLALHQPGEALRTLERMSLERTPSDLELYLLRGELRAEAGRCREALSDFTRVDGGTHDALAERALFGRADCLARLGDRALAKQELARYLTRFPRGERAAEVRRALERH